MVLAGTPVHDKVTVSATASGPTPVGGVNFDWFTNGTCTPNGQVISALTALSSGMADSKDDTPNFIFAPAAPGAFAFQARYDGNDPNYNAATSPCEPLAAVDAKIAISPLGPIDNTVGTTHDMTVTVTVAGGTLANAGANQGAAIAGAFFGGNVGSFNTQNCAVSGGGTAGFCGLQITSAVVGTDTVQATGTIHIDVDGDGVKDITLVRTTDGSATTITNNSLRAVKNWIAPCQAGERVVSLTLKRSATAGADLVIQAFAGNGKNKFASTHEVVGSPGAGNPISPGETFGPLTPPAGGKYGTDFFDSQTMRFTFGGGQVTTNPEVHLSCSDNPQIGDFYVIGGVTFELVGLATAVF